MIIQCIPPWTRPHFASASSNSIDMRPATFHSFSICSSDILIEVEGKIGLTAFNVGGKMEMEFGDKKVKGGFIFVVRVHPLRVLPHPFPQIYSPLTGDIVRYHDFDGLIVFDAWEEKIVHIYVPINDGISTKYTNESIHAPFSFLHITNRACSFHVVANAVASSNPASCKSFNSALLVHSTMVRTMTGLWRRCQTWL